MKKLLGLLLAMSLILCACTPSAVSSDSVHQSSKPDVSVQTSGDVPDGADDAEAGPWAVTEGVTAGTGAQDTIGPQEEAPAARPTESEQPRAEQTEEANLKLTINGIEIDVLWEDNESVAALRELAKQAPLTIQMSPYGGFEQVGPIGQSIPRNDLQTVTQPGDLVLYSGSQIVVFYGSNSWAYTRLGKIQGLDQGALTGLLGKDDVTLTLSFASTAAGNTKAP